MKGNNWTYLCLAFHKKDIDKQWSGSTLFALTLAISIKYGNNKNEHQTLFHLEMVQSKLLR